MKQKLTDGQVKKLFRMRESGMTMTQIGRELGVTKERVRQIINGQGFKHLGLKINPDKQTPIVSQSQKLSEHDVREIFRLRQQGLGPTEISQRFGIAISTVGFLLRGRTWNRLGLKLNNPPRIQGKATKYTDNVVREIFQMRASGKTHAEIAEHFNSRESTICQIIKQNRRPGVAVDSRTLKKAREVNSKYTKRLTPALVRRIIKMRDSGSTIPQIADRIGFSTSCVKNVLKRQTWAHVQIT